MIVQEEVRKLFAGRTLHFYLILTRNCNLKCSFCYQPGLFRSNEKMSLQIAEDTMNWIFGNFEEQNVKIMLWGGEPLMNQEVLFWLLDNYPQVRFTLVTNGFLIDEQMRRRLMKYSANLYISLSFANAEEVYGDKIWDRLKDALYLVRDLGGDVHFVSKNPDIMYDWFVKLDKEFNIPVIRMSVPRNVDIPDDILNRIENEWKKIVDYVFFTGSPRFEFTNFDRGIKSNLMKYLKGEPLDGIQPYYCGCGWMYISIDINGDLYPCDWMCALKTLKFGSIYSDMDLNSILEVKKMVDNKLDLYKSCPVYSFCDIPDVRLCPRAMCMAENLETTGQMNLPQPSHCKANLLEYRVHKYLCERLIKEGLECEVSSQSTFC